MTDVLEHFNQIFFTASTFGMPVIDGYSLRVPATGLRFLRDYPLPGGESENRSGVLIFEGVCDSRREVTEYVGDLKSPTGFLPRVSVVDSFPRHAVVGSEALNEYAFEGFQESPPAWIDNWIVKARQFRLRLQ